MEFNKEAVKTAMEEHLRVYGYPNLSNKEILQLVPSLYKFLKKRGLMPPQVSYLVFRQIAIVKYREAYLRGFR